MSRARSPYEPATPPATAEIARHELRIRTYLAATGLDLADRWDLDPAAQVDSVTGWRRLAAALARLNADQQAAAASSGFSLPSSPLRWGDAAGLQARLDYYADALLLRQHAAGVLALTPLPVTWVAQTLDVMQQRSLHGRVIGTDRLGQHDLYFLALSVIAFAADALAGTGELPAPHGIWRWLGSRGPSTRVPAFPSRYCRSPLTVEQRIKRLAYWDAAAERHGSDWHGDAPLQRYVPGWDWLSVLSAALGVDCAGSGWRRLRREMSRCHVMPPHFRSRTTQQRWRRQLLRSVYRDFPVQHPGRQIPFPVTAGNGPLWRWLRADDVLQRCRWRAYTLAGTNEALVDELERRLLRDTLLRYVLGTSSPDRTVLPAQGAWRDSLAPLCRRTRSWHLPPHVADGSVAHLVRLGYTPGRYRADRGLRGAEPDELATAAALTGGQVFT